MEQEKVTINGVTITVKEWNGRRVLTAKDIGAIFGRSVSWAKNWLAIYRDKHDDFFEGIDYYSLKNGEGAVLTQNAHTRFIDVYTKSGCEKIFSGIRNLDTLEEVAAVMEEAERVYFKESCNYPDSQATPLDSQEDVEEIIGENSEENDSTWNSLVKLDDSGMPCTSSLQIAKNFEKQHKNVIQAIENLQVMTSAEISANLFTEKVYTDSYGRKQKCYEVSRDGFVLLVMGFDGQNAFQWKLRYIEAFNYMEQILRSRQGVSGTPFEQQLCLKELELKIKQEETKQAEIASAERERIYNHFVDMSGSVSSPEQNDTLILMAAMHLTGMEMTQDAFQAILNRTQNARNTVQMIHETISEPDEETTVISPDEQDNVVQQAPEPVLEESAPECRVQLYTATEIGDMLGISKTMVGTIANDNGLKTPEYGIYDKILTKGGIKDTFLYNQSGVDAITKLYQERGSKPKEKKPAKEKKKSSEQIANESLWRRKKCEIQGES